MKKLVLLLWGLAHLTLNAQTPVSLDRGVVALPGNDGGIFISWRLLKSDPEGGLYNIYRKNQDGSTVKLNDQPVSSVTNYMDYAADLSKTNKYYVEAVQNKVATVKESKSVLPSNDAAYVVAAVPTEPYYTVNLRNGVDIHFCWVGDLDGDGANDYVIDRLSWGVGCKIEAYKSNGTFLWDVDYGPNSANMDNISPGSSTIDVGHWDGVTVADVTGDGRAEVITKIANGVRLGNGEVWSNSDNNKQWLAVLDGPTGARLKYIALPTDYLTVGPLACQLGVGNNNEIFVHAKNRNSNGSFNVISAVYTMGSSLTQKWKRLGGMAEGHQFRIVDVNEDGVDDFIHIGYALNGINGNVLYTLPGVVHGDRFHIGKFDPSRPGLQGYAVQQVNPSGLLEYYYDARNGQMIWTHTGAVADVGRGNAADIDPSRPGYEVWSFQGIYNAPTNTKLTSEPTRPWPNFRLWWDGDDGSELFDNGKIEEWNPTTNSVQRLLTCSQYNGAIGSDRGAPLFYGDISGDWREEVIMRNSTNNQLIIFTTNIPTTISRPSLTQDRYYRNDLTLKGYMQSHHTSYYLGEGGSTPGTGVTIQEAQTGFCSVDGTIDTDRAGYTGTGFANANNALGAGVSWKANVASNGTYTLTWRYSNGAAADRPARLLVNGAVVVSSISFPSTGGWTNWSTVSTNVTLTSGIRDLRLESTQASGLGNIDNIQLPAGLTAAACSSSARATTEALTEESKGILYPNPSRTSFTLKEAGAFTYLIKNVSGAIVEKGSGNNEAAIGEKLKAGLYVVTLQTADSIKQIKVIKE